MRPHPVLVQLAMIGTMLLWGISFVGSSIVLTEIDPITYMGLRFALASLVLGGVFLFSRRSRFSRRTHALIALTAVFEPVAYFLFETYGITIIGPTMTSLIIALIPLAVMILAALLLDEPIHIRGLLAVLVSILGIALLVYGDELTALAFSSDPAFFAEGSIDPLVKAGGVLLVLGAVFAAAGYITLARSLTQKNDPIQLTILQTWWGTLFFVSMWQIRTPGLATVAELSSLGWIAILFLVFGATVAAFLLYNWALRYEKAGTAALYINGIPIVTAATAWIVLGETLEPIQIFGAVLVLTAVRLSATKSAEVAATPLPPEA